MCTKRFSDGGIIFDGGCAGSTQDHHAPNHWLVTTSYGLWGSGELRTEERDEIRVEFLMEGGAVELRRVCANSRMLAA